MTENHLYRHLHFRNRQHSFSPAPPTTAGTSLRASRGLESCILGLACTSEPSSSQALPKPRLRLSHPFPTAPGALQTASAALAPEQAHLLPSLWADCTNNCPSISLRAVSHSSWRGKAASARQPGITGRWQRPAATRQPALNAEQSTRIATNSQSRRGTLHAKDDPSHPPAIPSCVTATPQF